MRTKSRASSSIHKSHTNIMERELKMTRMFFHRNQNLGSSARPSPRVRSPTENHELAQDFQRGSSSPAPYMRADGLEKFGVYCT
ncbi:hypothetical protein AVEN_201576-1 [Araneus ventricosus]|uniref:Uncharacterized protein n=1 Tax=Araneus ventricosus TaxID=182803 RepID=A0A4Y2M400_ARAVE|nr:hypothetical protein AVEN_201576-1 [Araneus ventricosus]